jgi:hypothetical protein
METIMSTTNDTEKKRELTEGELDAVVGGGRIKFNEFMIKKSSDP